MPFKRMRSFTFMRWGELKNPVFTNAKNRFNHRTCWALFILMIESVFHSLVMFRFRICFIIPCLWYQQHELQTTHLNRPGSSRFYSNTSRSLWNLCMAYFVHGQSNLWVRTYQDHSMLLLHPKVIVKNKLIPRMNAHY